MILCILHSALIIITFQLRQVERSMSVLTSLHLTLIKDIVRMSLSEYAQASYNYMKEYTLTIVLCTCWFK